MSFLMSSAQESLVVQCVRSCVCERNELSVHQRTWFLPGPAIPYIPYVMYDHAGTHDLLSSKQALMVQE